MRKRDKSFYSEIPFREAVLYMRLQPKCCMEKYRSIARPAKAAIWFTICSFILKGISFITVPIFTRIISLRISFTAATG